MNRDIVELREVVQKLVPLLAGKGLIVTQRGSQAYVATNPVTKKPERVNIPNISDNAQPDFILAIQGFIDHEIGHVLYTDWNYYGRGVSAAKLNDPEVQKFMNTHNIVEDTMIERVILKDFPGAERNISNVRKYFLQRITAEALKTAKDDKEEFIYLIVPTMRALAGHVEMQDFMDAGKYWSNKYVDGVVKGLKPSTLKLLRTCTTTKETLEISEELHTILYPPTPPAPPAAATPPPPKSASADKPDKKAGEGDGDGERDHDESDAEGEGDENDKGESGKSKEKSKGTDDDGDNEDEPDEDDGSSGSDPSEKEDEEDGDAKDKDDDSDDEADESDASSSAGEAEKDDEKDDSENGSSEADDETDEDEDGSDSAGADGDDAEAGDEGDSAGSGGKSDDPSDDDVDDEGSGSAGGEQSDSEGEDESDSSSGTSSIRTIGADGGGVGDIDVDVSDDKGDSGGGGVGNQASKSIFEFTDDAFKEADMSSQIGILISEDAVTAMDRSGYVVFSRELDQIEPVVVPENINGTWVPRMEDDVRSLTGRMQKDVERLMASQSHIIRTPGHRKGKLHAPSLYRVMQNDPRVFTQKQEHVSKDTAVMLLCDNSGSMRGPKMKLAMMAAYALTTTLERVQIAHEVIGFTTGSWYSTPQTLRDAMSEDRAKSGIDYDRVEPIIMPIYKDFKERLTATVKARFAYMMNAQLGLSGNIDGESLEYAAIRLQKRPEKRKVMLVLSDGQPAGSSNSGPHLSYMVRHIEKSGIECVGVGIMDDSVKRFYPKHVVLNNVNDLPNEVMSEIKRILA